MVDVWIVIDNLTFAFFLPQKHLGRNNIQTSFHWHQTSSNPTPPPGPRWYLWWRYLWESGTWSSMWSVALLRHSAGSWISRWGWQHENTMSPEVVWGSLHAPTANWKNQNSKDPFDQWSSVDTTWSSSIFPFFGGQFWMNQAISTFLICHHWNVCNEKGSLFTLKFHDGCFTDVRAQNFFNFCASAWLSSTVATLDWIHLGGGGICWAPVTLNCPLRVWWLWNQCWLDCCRFRWLFCFFGHWI